VDENFIGVVSSRQHLRTFRCLGFRDEQILPILQRLSNFVELEPYDEGASYAVPSSPTMMCISRMLNFHRQRIGAINKEIKRRWGVISATKKVNGRRYCDTHGSSFVFVFFLVRTSIYKKMDFVPVPWFVAEYTKEKEHDRIGVLFR